MGSTPVALSCICPHPNLFFPNSQPFKIIKACADFLPSFPRDHPYAASNPFIKPSYQISGICQLEVVHPPADYLIQAVFTELGAHPFATSDNFPDFVFKLFNTFGMYPKSSFTFVDIEAISKVFNLAYVCRLGFLLVYF